MDKLELKLLPMHELKRIAKERGIVAKPTLKKSALIDLLLGKEAKPMEKSIAPRMDEVKENRVEARFTGLPDSVQDLLDRAGDRVTATIDKDSNCVTFKAHRGSGFSSVCVNLDTSEAVIKSALLSVFQGELASNMDAY